MIGDTYHMVKSSHRELVILDNSSQHNY